MVYTNRPITKYCCSDSPETEARIISKFSIIATLTTTFILFLIYSHTQSTEFPDNAIANKFAESNVDDAHVELTTEPYSQGTKKESDIPITLFPELDQNYASENNSRTETNANQNFSSRSSSPLPHISSSTLGNMKPSLNNSKQDLVFDTEFQTTPGESTLLPNLFSETATTTLQYSSTATSRRLVYRKPAQITRNEVMKMNVSQHGEYRQAKKSANSDDADYRRKEESPTALDAMAHFLLWNRNMDFNRALPLFLWNVMDLVRGIILLTGLVKKLKLLLRIWYLLTSMNCLLAIIVFFLVIYLLTSGSYLVIIILLVQAYNLYALWIVNLLLKESRRVTTDEILPQVKEDQPQLDTHVEKF